MRKLAGLILGALLVTGMVTAGTWAYFSDSEVSAGNVLSASTLDLAINGDNNDVTTFCLSNVSPGDSGSGIGVLNNAGSIDGILSIALSLVANVANTDGTEYEGGSGELGANTEIALYLDIDNSGSWNEGDTGIKSDGTTYEYPDLLGYSGIDSYGSRSWDNVQTMAPSSQEKFVALWRVPAETGNEIQGDSIIFNIEFTLNQVGNPVI